MAVIGIMDSGAGGLSVLKEIRKTLPDESCIYYSDNAWCPYGDKSPDFIRGRASEITRTLIDRGAGIMVLACNTATAAAISYLRENFSIPFVGMEPAVKPAALGTGSGVIGVLATAGTLSASKYLHTRDLYADGIRVVEHVGKGFVELVESGELEGPHAEETVRASLMPLLEAGADIIVLGCTHYPFLLPLMKKVAGNGVRFIDPAPAIAKRVAAVMKEKGIPSGSSDTPTEFLSSGSDVILRRLAELNGIR